MRSSLLLALLTGLLLIWSGLFTAGSASGASTLTVQQYAQLVAESRAVLAEAQDTPEEQAVAELANRSGHWILK